MDVYEHYMLKHTVDGFIIDTVKMPIRERLAFERKTSWEYAKSKSSYIYKEKGMEERVIEDFFTISSGIFSSEAVFSLKFKDGGKTVFKPVNCPYVDIEIYFEKIDATYRPKIYGGMPDAYPSGFEDFAMNNMDETSYFTDIKIRSFKLFLDKKISSDNNAFDEKIYAIKIGGILDFKNKDSFSYDHIDTIEMVIYPDIIHQLAEVGADVPDKDFHLKTET